MHRLMAMVLALALPGGLALGQTLGELADNTKKKRKGGAPTYTDNDLKKGQAAPAPPAAAPAAGRAVPAPARTGGDGSAGRSGRGEGGAGDGSIRDGEGGSGDGSSGGGGGEGEEGRGSRSGGRNDQGYWRQQAAQHRAAINKAEQGIAAAQQRLNALMSDLVPTGVMDPFQQQNLEAERAKARGELAEAEKALERAEDAFHEFEEEARRKAIPPGWLEER